MTTHAMTPSPRLARGRSPHPPRRGAGALLLLIVGRCCCSRSCDDNDADIDSIANAAAYATLALGLNIVVGFAGLLDLGYAAFFAIGAYFYGMLTSFQVMPLWSRLLAALRAARPGGEDQPGRRRTWCISRCRSGSRCRCRRWSRRSSACCSARPRCGCAATTWPSSRSASARSCRSCARNTPSVTNGAAGLNGVQAPTLFGYSFGVQATPYYYVGLALVALLIFVSIRLREFAHRPRLDGDPRGRDGGERDGRRT